MLKNQKGITLIALIITIIVMLILVGVTINVALNGGLFTKAEDAAIGTEKQAIYEQIVSNMELTNDGKISVKGTFDKVIAELGADKVTNINPATVDENTTEVTFSIVGKTGTYSYKISTREIEKDSVQTPGGIQPPSQTGDLVYGKLYKGTLVEGGETVDYSICFYEKLGIAIQCEDIVDCQLFSYNKENRTIELLGGMLMCSLSQDGETISGESTELQAKINLQLTDEEFNYSPEDLVVDGVQCSYGLYYDENDTDNLDMIICVNNNGRYDEFTRIDLTGADGTRFHPITKNDIIDKNHVTWDGVTYTLLETLE